MTSEEFLCQTKRQIHDPSWPSPWVTQPALGPKSSSKQFNIARVYQRARPLVIGDARILQRAAGWLGVPLASIELVTDPAAGRYSFGELTLLDLANVSPADCPPGKISQAAGRAAVEYVFKACDLAMAQQVDAVVTAPLNKGRHEPGWLSLCRAHRITH